MTGLFPARRMRRVSLADGKSRSTPDSTDSTIPDPSSLFSPERSHLTTSAATMRPSISNIGAPTGSTLSENAAIADASDTAVSISLCNMNEIPFTCRASLPRARG